MTSKVVQLGDVADMLSGFAFKSQQFLDASEEGIKLVRGDNVQQGFIRWGDKAKKWRSDAYSDFQKYQLEFNDVILAMDRPIVGGGLKLAWIKEQDLPSLLVQRVTRIRGKSRYVLTNYLRYVLSSPDFVAHVDKITTGANIPHISGKDIARFEFKLPSLSEQESIIDLIGRYDELIETNQRRIALLEESARLLYREWFVNLRFPGHESVKWIDGLPEDWMKMELSSLANIEMGQSPESKYYNTEGEGLPFHQGVSDFGEYFVTHRVYTTVATRRAKAGDILCSVRAPVGRLNLTHDDIAIGRGLAAIRSLTNQQALLFFQLKTLFIKEDMIGGGTIFSSVGKKELFSQKILQPNTAIASEFEQFASAALSQVEVLTMQNRLLIEARNDLLPKLISGAIQV